MIKVFLKSAPQIALCSFIVAGLCWFCLYLADPSGSQGLLFSDAWRDAFGDFFLNCREWSASEHYVGDSRVPTYELVYPLVAYWPMSLFPDSICGAACFSFLGVMCLAFGLIVFARNKMKSSGVCVQLVGVLACLCSFHVIFAFERANFILFSAACVCVFLAWYDSQNYIKRICAAVVLAIAGSTKIMPAAFGLLYFTTSESARNGGAGGRRRVDWMSVFVCVSSAMAMFFIPYWINGRGVADIQAFLNNVSVNSKIYGPMSAWGIVAFCRELLFVGYLGGDDIIGFARAGNLILGFILLLMSVFVGHQKLQTSHRLLLLTTAIMLIPANSCTYMALYLLPTLLISVSEMMSRPLRVVDGVILCLWILVFLPIQIPVSLFCGPQGITLNYSLSNFSLMLLVLIVVVSLNKKILLLRGRKCEIRE